MQNDECRMQSSCPPNSVVRDNPEEQNSCSMKYQNLQQRTRQFALEVIKFCEALPKDDTSKILRRQLLRSGTSVRANSRAAVRAKSKPAFISKMGDVLEEADESGYWIELLTESQKATRSSPCQS